MKGNNRSYKTTCIMHPVSVNVSLRWVYLGTVGSETSKQENSLGCGSHVAQVDMGFGKVSRSPVKDPDHGIVCGVP